MEKTFCAFMFKIYMKARKVNFLFSAYFTPPPHYIITVKGLFHALTSLKVLRSYIYVMSQQSKIQ